MANGTIGQKIIHLESIDSTNNYAANVFRSGEIEHGTVILADIQTNGRGQRGNTWQSGAFENITMSIAIDPNLCKINNLISLNHLTSITLFKLISSYCKNVKIKWPNDILVGDNKIAGILIESQFSGNKTLSVIGIGLNVNQVDFQNSKSTSLKIETSKNLNIKSVMFEFISLFNDLIIVFQKFGEKNTHQVFDKHLWLRNKETQFLRNEEVFSGTIISTDMQGQLNIRINETSHFFKNGDIKYMHRLDN